MFTRSRKGSSGFRISVNWKPAPSVAGVFAERLLTYAVGRAMRPQDMPAVRAISRAAAQNQYRFSSFVMAIVKSAPFQMKTKAAGES